MKNNSAVIVLIVILALMAIASTIGFIFLLSGNFKFSFGNARMELVDTKEVDSAKINKFNFDLLSMDVEIKKSENEFIKVELYSNTEENPEIRIEGDAVIINENDAPRNWGFFINNSKKTVIYVPDSFLGEYNFSIASGDVTSSIDMSKNKISIKTTSGDIKLNKVGPADITTASGDLFIDESTDYLRAVTTSGDVKVDVTGNEIALKTTSGDILVGDLKITKNSSIETTSGDVAIRNNISNCYVSGNALSGDVKINNSDRKSDIELSIKTTSGDILVN